MVDDDDGEPNGKSRAAVLLEPQEHDGAKPISREGCTAMMV